MSVGWESLPLLPLRCVLEHLSLQSAVAAMSVCRHWRSAALVFEGHKELLKLRVTQMEKNLFLARLFRRNVQQLHVYIDSVGDDLDKFFNIVLPEFYDAVNLKELLFIGPKYLQQNYNLPPAKLKRILIESLVFKHSHSLVKFAMFGCEMDVANENDRYMHEQIEYYSAPLTFNTVATEADRILSSTNTSLMVFSNLQHILVDYNQLSSPCVDTLSQLPLLSRLSLTVTSARGLAPRDWSRLPAPVAVCLNIVGLPPSKLNDVIENVMVEGMPLTSLKVLFCKTLYNPLLTHAVRLYKASLREVVWADCPYDADPYQRIVCHPTREIDSCNINPFILMCWQCVNLRRLVIHGYWVWQYDVLGFVRLRKSLQQLEISAIYSDQTRFHNSLAPSAAVRVLPGDAPPPPAPDLLQQVNEFMESAWSPSPWGALPAALRRAAPPAAPAARAHYVRTEATHAIGFTDTM